MTKEVFCEDCEWFDWLVPGHCYNKKLGKKTWFSRNDEKTIDAAKENRNNNCKFWEKRIIKEPVTMEGNEERINFE